MADEELAALGVGGPCAGALYHRPPPPKKKKKPAAQKAGPPTTLGDLSLEAKVAQQRRKSSKTSNGIGGGKAASGPGGLTKISEAAEWADESSRAQVDLDDEFEELFSEFGAAQPQAKPVEDPPPVPAGSSDSSLESGGSAASLLAKYGKSGGSSAAAASAGATPSASSGLAKPVTSPLLSASPQPQVAEVRAPSPQPPPAASAPKAASPLPASALAVASVGGAISGGAAVAVDNEDVVELDMAEEDGDVSSSDSFEQAPAADAFQQVALVDTSSAPAAAPAADAFQEIMLLDKSAAPTTALTGAAAERYGRMSGGESDEDEGGGSDDSSEAEVETSGQAGRSAADLEMLTRRGGSLAAPQQQQQSAAREEDVSEVEEFGLELVDEDSEDSDAREAYEPSRRGATKEPSGMLASDELEEPPPQQGREPTRSPERSEGSSVVSRGSGEAVFAAARPAAGEVAAAQPRRSPSHSPSAPPELVRNVPGSGRGTGGGGGGLGLLAMMDNAVASTEHSPSRQRRDAEAPAPTSVAPPQRAAARPAAGHAGGEEPEVAGLESAYREQDDVRRAVSGQASRLLGQGAVSSTGTGKPQGRLVGRADIFEQAIHKGPQVKDSAAPGSSSRLAGTSAAMPLGSAVGLAGLRKAYDGGATKKTGESGGVARPPEEPPEEQEEDADQPEDGHRRPAQAAGSAAAGEAAAGPQDYTALTDEWDDIEARTDEIRAKEEKDRGKIRTQDDILQKPISWHEVHQWLLQEVTIDPAVLEQFKKEEVFETSCISCMGRRRCLSDVPGLDRKLWKDKDLVLFLKATDFDFNQPIHFRMLRTAYMKLTRNKVCPSIGVHWEVMGFQHTDPRTDLNRSGGILNVLHLFFMFAHHFDILKSAYLLAQDSEQNFPLGCVSINITRMVVEYLLEGRLSSLCNSGENGVLDTTCRVYAGGFYHFYSRWRSLKRTIRDTEVTFNEVRRLMEKSPKKLLDGLAKGIEEMKAKKDPGKFEFTDLDFTSRAPQAGAPKAAARPGTATAVPRRLRNYQDAE